MALGGEGTSWGLALPEAREMRGVRGKKAAA